MLELIPLGMTLVTLAVMLSYVARALDGVQPVGERVFEALASPVSSVPGLVVPRLASAFWSMTAPVVLVHQRTEGRPAGLYLAALHLREKRRARDGGGLLRRG